MSERELIDWHAAEVRLGHAGAARAREVDRLPAGLRDRALHQGLRLSGRQIPLQAGLAERCRSAAPITPGPIAAMPKLPDHWTIIEEADAAHPFRLATSPSRGFLNSTFNETPSSRAQNRGRPEVMIHPDDAAALGIADGAEVVIGNTRGQVRLHARVFDGRAPRRADRGIDLAERRLSRRQAASTRVTGADAIAPYGGAAFHDNRVWIRPYVADRFLAGRSRRHVASADRLLLHAALPPPSAAPADRCGARPRARARRAWLRCRRHAPAPRACAMIGPESISGTTKCTVAPCSFAPAASARAWVSRPLKAGSRAGWMLIRRPSHCRTNHGVSSRMKPARQTSSMRCASSSACSARSNASRSLPNFR